MFGCLFVLVSAQNTQEMSERGYHALKAGLATHHLKSLGNLTAYLVPKDRACVSFGHLLLGGLICRKDQSYGLAVANVC